MTVEALKHNRVVDFVEYCKKHRLAVDDSFLYDEDLETFEPNADNPTYVITGQQGEIIAAASLIMDEYQKRGKRARFRIFLSEANDKDQYKLLLESLLKHTAGLERVYIFVPLANKLLSEAIKQLDFSVERYAFVMVREDLDVPELNLPDGYSIRNFQPGQDEEVWCEVRNAGFATLKGSETPRTPDMIAKMVSESDYIEGGMKILYHIDKPVGVARGAADEYENAPIMNIGPLAVLPEYQGKGLGRLLLRAALHVAKDKAYKRTILSVNGENERAQALYIREGFKQVEGAVCYEYRLVSC
ncbi:GNAT family N-acetyltransferase [Neobacillus niacini]|uniref:GNAT family N-acetyltransferase n=1 Tax=Neobacillus niacini TaxID=86668 RepID=UPI0021CB321C|nr:GNAT family N-acetyltransferase [Neobacillus niacini]MCM3766745.1 GNAT family N-acetyltransferase [Neobacillus niacini]